MMQHEKKDTEGTKKWHATDILILAAQIVLPLLALLITWKAPTSSIAEDTKLAIIGLGLLVPLILTQVSITVGQNKSEMSVQELERHLQKLDDRINHIHPTLETALHSKNDRVMRFALKRMAETNKIIQYAATNLRSDYLKPGEYLDELDYLADLIIKDKKLKKKNFSGEIWAMTSFAPDEWTVDGLYSAWTSRMTELYNLDIKMQRLCMVNDAFVRAISQYPFTEPTKDEVPIFSEFMALLKTYYGVDSKRRNVARHYIVRDSANADLKNAHGFFAIILSSGEMHILTGETIDIYGSLSAYALFDEVEIKKLHGLCKKYMVKNNSLEAFIQLHAKEGKGGFIDYLHRSGITFNAVPPHIPPPPA